jgi:hypothetical protein
MLVFPIKNIIFAYIWLIPINIYIFINLKKTKMSLKEETLNDLFSNAEQIQNKITLAKNLGDRDTLKMYSQQLVLLLEEMDEIELSEGIELEGKVKYDVNGIYPTQIEFAHDIYNAFLRKNIVIAKAPMQYGKTSTIFYLANALLSKILEPGENIIFMTSMSDTALLIQNKNNLEVKKFITEKGVRKNSKIIVTKMNPNFRDNAEQLIKDNNIKYIIFDECDYGSGNKSLFNKSFFSRLKKSHFNLKVLLISATPYCALNAVYNNVLDAEIVEAKIPENYFGINQMLQHGMIRDINNMYDDEDIRIPYNIISRDENKGFNLSYEFKEDLNWFQSQNGGGLAIVRAKNTRDAHLIEALTTAHFKNSIEIVSDVEDAEFEAIAIGVNSIAIKEILGDSNITLKNKIIHNGNKILLIVVNALSAGKDLGELKNYVRLVVETRKNAVANGSQGLIGRVCGYHNNRNIKMVGSLDILRNYGQLEYDAKVMNNQEFINEILEFRLDFSTQLNKDKKRKLKTLYEQKVHGVFKLSDIAFKNQNLINLFPDNDNSFGTWEELKAVVINKKRSASGSAINTQRSSNYEKHADMFDTIWNECKDGTIDFGSRFHRFRAEGNDDNRLRIKRGIIVNDETEEFYIVDRLSDGVKIISEGTVKNNSCYIK